MKGVTELHTLLVSKSMNALLSVLVFHERLLWKVCTIVLTDWKP